LIDLTSSGAYQTKCGRFVNAGGFTWGWGESCIFLISTQIEAILNFKLRWIILNYGEVGIYNRSATELGKTVVVAAGSYHRIGVSLIHGMISQRSPTLQWAIEIKRIPALCGG
jgi:hypothetical protein